MLLVSDIYFQVQSPVLIQIQYTLSIFQCTDSVFISPESKISLDWKCLLPVLNMYLWNNLCNVSLNEAQHPGPVPQEATLGEHIHTVRVKFGKSVIYS